MGSILTIVPPIVQFEALLPRTGSNAILMANPSVLEKQRMKLPVVVTKSHRGKALELDSERETMSLLSTDGELIGRVSWEAVINYIRALGERPRAAESRSQPRASLSFPVRYLTAEGSDIEAQASGVGGGGLFIESTVPLRVGTEIAMEFILPDGTNEWLKARGTVAWVCPKPDQYSFHPGMGISFTHIEESARERILDLIRTLSQSPMKTTA